MLMAKLSGKWQRTLQALYDLLALTAAWHLTGMVRIAANPWMSVHLSEYDVYRVTPPLSGILASWLFAAFVTQLYRARNYQSVGDNLIRATEAVAIAGSLTIAFTFFSRQFSAELSRSIVILLLPISFAIVMASRYTALLAASYAQQRWAPPRRIAVLGEHFEARWMLEQIKPTSDLIDLAGVILPEDAGWPADDALLPVLGTTREAAQVVNRERLDTVILLKSAGVEPDIEEAGIVFKRMGVTVSHAIQLASPDTQLYLNLTSGIPLVEVRTVEFRHMQARLKRALDVSICLLALLLAAPLMGVIALAIKLTSKGPVFYSSLRVGKGGRHFTFLKFRSMRVEPEGRRRLAPMNEKSGHIFKIKNDPRVTPIGRFIRRYSLDELPQLINVLLGDMSLVGPRPLPATDLNMDGMSDRYPEWASCRAQVAPGMSGLWQVRGRSGAGFEQMVRYDIEYVRQWSLALDCRILFETPLVVISGRGAY